MAYRKLCFVGAKAMLCEQESIELYFLTIRIENLLLFNAFKNRNDEGICC